jgi:hypothetical protein
VRREELTRAGDARYEKAAGLKIWCVERHRERIAVGVTRDLAEYPVAAPGVSKADCRPEFRRGQVGEGERDEDYFSG